jgi:NTE family protein
MSDGEPTRVAIACQGGGSHTAFTAGVLKELLREWDHEEYELVGISGTSGGAYNALMTWYGLLTGGEKRAIELLDAVWDDLAADSVPERFANHWMANLKRIEDSGIPMLQISPYRNPYSGLGKRRLRRIFESYIDFDEIPALCGPNTPELAIGSVNINAGVFETFRNEDVTIKSILASAALPEYFEAVEIDGDHYWDGVFSQNPPIDELMDVDAHRKPEELWIIQINPQEREDEPTTFDEISNRRNELFGNISLNQELRSIERVNEWVEEGYLPETEFTHTEIRRIHLDEPYHRSSKFDRSRRLIDELTELGEQRAREFRQSLAASNHPTGDAETGSGEQGAETDD